MAMESDSVAFQHHKKEIDINISLVGRDYFGPMGVSVPCSTRPGDGAPVVPFPFTQSIYVLLHELACSNPCISTCGAVSRQR
jgi:hypothetical protein